MSRLPARPCGLVILAAVVAWPAAAAPPFEVKAGIGGVRQTGAWTPLVVSAPSSALAVGETLHVAVEDPDGQFVRSPPAVVAVDDAGRASARFCVRFGRPSGRVRVDHGGAAVEALLGEPIPSTDTVIVVYGDLPAVGRVARLLDRDHGTKTRVVVSEPRDGLFVEGASARDYDAADTIVVCGRAVASLPADVVAGIDAWVAGGGRLVFLAGASAEAVAAGPAAAWLPGRFERLAPLRRLGAIEAHARAGGLIDRVPTGELPLPRFAAVEGVVEAASDEPTAAPLVVRRCRGLGTITWVGLDIDAEPLRGWKGADSILLAAVGGRGRAEPPAGRPAATADLAAQLRAALDTFPIAGSGRSSRPVPFELIAAVGILYVLCLFPLDWWLVSRSGRPWLAWITLPAFAAAFTGIAAAVAGGWGSNAAPAASVAGIVDVDVQSGLARGHSWAAVWSPANDLLDVAATPPAAWRGGDTAVSWFADAGRGFAGVESAAAHPSLAADDYGYADSLASLDGPPIAAASSRLFECEWTATAGGPAVESTLARNEQGTLEGAVVLRLPFTLENCRLLHAGWLYDVGTLRPGDRHDTASGRGPRSFASALTRRAATHERELAALWNPAETDVARILEVAAFHAAAGGTAYTGGAAGRLERLDMSTILATDRAVLVGLAAEGRPAVDWSLTVRSGSRPVVPSPAAATLCRIVIPLDAEPDE